ncbi:enoyl-CoA hydratase/isomerase family protein [Pseudoflavonifractor phocaeensis]|uniref:enoyl-CoA hydratase/isomerase family protein n=1 Tax=Pseudoflavonifractor phocaeensis TaxID=1870988 RepID=UPI00195CE4B3|nr:enoyl-CoA hydratase/isomerase family protein [Pseudoflavonifractor phocaeensis]MBM6871385.1 enoyl-CoA hydratase/isomerase family protein [Pseudoflavonifractor phocaeensis]MBM6937913.1 enoyl-CoA hydratase/isomerase family protein [Pseudoflavonifractor phocaeensis]
MDYTTILVRVENRVATVTINRPEVRNALARETYGEIASAMAELGARKDVGAIVITGAGKHFSAGGDIKRFKELIDTGVYLDPNQILRADAMATAIRECPKPVIAMINGTATGAGLSCALACDFRVVSPSSKLVMAFVNLGLSGDTGSIYNLMRLVGPERAELLMMTGEPCPGEECVRIGLASQLAEEGHLAEAAYALAAKLAAKSTDAHAAQKRILRQFFYDRLEEYYAKEALEIAWCARQPDFAEAVNAFLERRPPVYNREG